jgi:hypothetical protein
MFKFKPGDIIKSYGDDLIGLVLKTTIEPSGNRYPYRDEDIYYTIYWIKKQDNYRLKKTTNHYIEQIHKYYNKI